MKVRTVSEIIGTERDVHGVGFRSLRIILAKDRMGFSLHKTVIPAGDTCHWHYKNHLESCYCVAGHGELINLETGDRYDILPDTTYILDSHDDHTFRAIEDVILISVFNPPVVGNEVHGKDGSYELR